MSIIINIATVRTLSEYVTQEIMRVNESLTAVKRTQKFNNSNRKAFHQTRSWASFTTCSFKIYFKCIIPYPSWFSKWTFSKKVFTTNFCVHFLSPILSVFLSHPRLQAVSILLGDQNGRNRAFPFVCCRNLPNYLILPGCRYSPKHFCFHRLVIPNIKA